MAARACSESAQAERRVASSRRVVKTVSAITTLRNVPGSSPINMSARFAISIASASCP